MTRGVVSVPFLMSSLQFLNSLSSRLPHPPTNQTPPESGRQPVSSSSSFVRKQLT